MEMTLDPSRCTVERTDDTSVLSDFYCGVKSMDDFIHNQVTGLKAYVDAHLTNLWIVRQADSIVGFFALSKGSLILSSRDSVSMDSAFEAVDNFPALKIDYLAINEDYRRHGIGSSILGLIRSRAIADQLSATLFIIVEALDTAEYSAVRFYKKNYFTESEYGITRNQNKRIYGERTDTVLMYLPLF